MCVKPFGGSTINWRLVFIKDIHSFCWTFYYMRTNELNDHVNSLPFFLLLSFFFYLFFFFLYAIKTLFSFYLFSYQLSLLKKLWLIEIGYKNRVHYVKLILYIYQNEKIFCWTWPWWKLILYFDLINFIFFIYRQGRPRVTDNL